MAHGVLPRDEIICAANAALARRVRRGERRLIFRGTRAAS
jgi:hypothetical protein